MRLRRWVLLPVLIGFRSARTALSAFTPTFAAFTPAITLAAGRAFRSGGGGFSSTIGLDGGLSGSVQGGWRVVALWAGWAIATRATVALAAFVAALARTGLTGWALGAGVPKMTGKLAPEVFQAFDVDEARVELHARANSILAPLAGPVIDTGPVVERSGHGA